LSFNVTFAEDIINNSFITEYEYGAMLYENPRGIGCNRCHGRGDKSIVIAKYKDKKNKTKTLVAPAIKNVPFEKYVDVLTTKRGSSNIMPSYFLTDDEIKSIYFYVKNLKK
jgi:mono/diheme cytochrome c family protein